MMKPSQSQKTKNIKVEEKIEKMNGITIFLIVISFLLIGFSFVAPYLFTHYSGFGEFPNNNIIGDTIGGIMNPLVALAGVFITFLAFYMQYRANTLQQKLYYRQVKEQRDQLKTSQFESQFYEMLRLHKENINEMMISGYDVEKIQSFNSPAIGASLAAVTKTTSTQKIERIINGRKLFVAMKTELESIIGIYKQNIVPFDKAAFKVCYRIFFFGLDYVKEILKTEKRFDVFLKNLTEARDQHLSSHGANNIYNGIKIYIKYKPFSGHQSRLAHYYRHLFFTVKIVANQDEKLISYEEKRNYLRTLRAQLSNHEQALLFYNWLSDFGAQWESEQNKFFTDYRMIHNIFQDLLIEDFELEKLFPSNCPYRKEKGRENDPLFEYQD